jgi:hypothetical protein
MLLGLGYLLLNIIFQLNSKHTHFLTYVYMKFFLCFDLKNSLFKFVQAVYTSPYRQMLQAGTSIYSNVDNAIYALGSDIYTQKSKYCINVSSINNKSRKFECYIFCHDVCLLAGISRIGNSYEE